MHRIDAVDARDASFHFFPGNGPDQIGSWMNMQNTRGVFVDAGLGRAIRRRPPAAAFEIYVIRHTARRRDGTRRAVASPKALQSHAGEVLAVHADELGGHGSDEFRLPFY